MAIANGLDVPLYVITGWDNAVVSKGAVLPLYGGYPDAPWDALIEELPANGMFISSGLGVAWRGRYAGHRRTGAAAAEKTSENTPFITAEIGGGMQDTYHRRPVITADDVAAIFR